MLVVIVFPEAASVQILVACLLYPIDQRKSHNQAQDQYGQEIVKRAMNKLGPLLEQLIKQSFFKIFLSVYIGLKCGDLESGNHVTRWILDLQVQILHFDR